MTAAAEVQPLRGGRLIYTITLFTILYMFMYLDRNLLNLLLESIKKEMDLNDTVLALIAGFGFSFFHTIVGIPAARWADASDRRKIITLSCTIWGGMTVLCGLAANAWQLALARIGVGIGEATSPVLHSILSDSTTKDNRAWVMSILMMGGSLAALFCYPVIGWMDGEWGWRTAFVAAGIPGLLVGALVFLTYRDRIREVERNKREPAPPMKDVLKFFGTQKAFVFTILGFIVSQFGVAGFTTFAPTLLRRVHEMSPSVAGLSFGVVTGSLGILGALSGAWAVERSARYGDKWKSLLPAMATVLIGPFILLAATADSAQVTLFAMGWVAFMGAFKFGPIIALNQSVVKPRMRALASSIQGFGASILAVGGGPLFVGAISDALEPSMGVESLRIPLALCGLFTVAGAVLIALGARTVAKDIQTAEGA